MDSYGGWMLTSQLTIVSDFPSYSLVVTGKKTIRKYKIKIHTLSLVRKLGAYIFSCM